ERRHGRVRGEDRGDYETLKVLERYNPRSEPQGGYLRVERNVKVQVSVSSRSSAE
ncbi:unnamed protein product, partial [Symbiodinium natans]